jgi:hypothetical protein
VIFRGCCELIRVLVGRPLGRSRRRWEDYIKMDLREIGDQWGELH